MKQTCGSIREWLGAFADGELDPARAEQAMRHLETCAACRRELDEIQELHRLAKSVEHPKLAEDYWDWQRTRVWRGIRERKHVPQPEFRPSFVWPKLAAVAAGFVVVLVVVIAGWRTLLLRQGPTRPVGELPAALQRAQEPPVAAAPGAKGSAEAGKVTEETPGKIEGRSDQLAQTPAATEGSAAPAKVGHAARGAGATRATAVSKSITTPANRALPEAEIAALRRNELPSSAPSAGAQHVRSSSEKQKGRIVSGPVLLESPPLADADVTDTGTVLLSIKTDSTGRVLSAAVRRSSGSSKLDSVAVRQIRQSRFKAAVKNSRSVSSSFEYPFRVQRKQATPKEQQKPQTEQGPREVQKPQGRQSAPTQDDKSQKQDSGKQDRPQRENR
jgi:TonB family protein